MPAIDELFRSASPFLLQASPPEAEPGITTDWWPGVLLVLGILFGWAAWSYWRRKKKAG